MRVLVSDMDIEKAFADLQPLIDTLITNRIVDFHAALVARGQISPPSPQQGVSTADCTAGAVQPSNPSQSRAV